MTLSPLIILTALCWTPSSVHMSLVPRSPELDRPLQVYLTSAEQRGNIPSLSLPNEAQDALDFLCSQGAEPACVQFYAHRHPQGLLCHAAFQTAGPQPLPAAISPQQLDFAFAFVELHEVPVSLFFQLDEISWNGSTTTWCNNDSSQFCLQAC